MNGRFLEGRVAVVTGASSGLGVAFATGFADAGADVVLAARRVDRLANTAQAIAPVLAELVERCTEYIETLKP